MPSANGKRATTRKPKTRPFVEGPVILTSDELTKVRNWFETWHAQRMRSRNEQLLEAMAQEAYTRCIREIQTKYGLPPKYAIDFDTGACSAVDGAAAVNDG